MTRFIQLHALTIYPPSNLNRDDSGRPKTARFGGVERLRISSQAIKRALRTDEAFRKTVGSMGTRTARFGDDLRVQLIGKGIEEAKATAIARSVAALFGKPDDKAADGKVLNKELFFMAPEEQLALASMMEKIAADETLADELAAVAGALEADDGEDDENEVETKKGKGKKKVLPKKRVAELRRQILVTADTAADIAMFGRMLASAPEYNREAAVQIAHAITTHRVDLDDDFYTAVDDLKKPSEDAGAGFIGELQFGSGVFYIYACIDRDQLERNLGGDKALASKAIAALAQGLVTASPSGKQNSFASRARASYLRVEKGPQQPRTLAAAFFKPVSGPASDRAFDLLRESIDRIEHQDKGLAAQMTKAYGPCFDDVRVMRFIPGDGDNTSSLADLVAFASGE